MITIWKYPLVVKHGEQAIEMPKGAAIRCAQFQNGEIHLWAEVDSDVPIDVRKFETFGTGWGIEPSPRKYIGTVQVRGFVWHIYENL